MAEPQLIPEKDVFGLDKPQSQTPVGSDGSTGRKTVLFTVILIVVAAAIAAGLYFLQR